jgi:hypothetical protein
MTNARKLSIVSASIAARIQPFVSNEQTRYYLNGFALQPHPVKGAYVVATDGHRLGIFHDPDAVVAEACVVQLSKDAVEACKASVGKRGVPQSVYIDHNANVAYVAPSLAEDETAPANLLDLQPSAVSPKVLIDHAFPDWSRVCPPAPSDNPLQPTGFNSKYLADFGTVANVRGAPIVVHSEDPSSPAWVFVSGCPEFVGVLMPIRVSHNCALPSWLFQRPETPKQEAAE